MREDERVQRLRSMYWKYKEQGLDDAATRTVARIHELGGTLADPDKVEQELQTMRDRGEI